MDGAAVAESVRSFALLAGAAALVALVARRFAIQYTVALVLFGLALAVLAPRLSLAITPEVVLLVLLPGLVFEAAYHMDLSELRTSFGWVVILAAPGVLVSAAVVAVILHLAAGLPLDLAFVVGAIVSATDPAAVIATFRTMRAPPRLSTLVEAESLFNDGTAIVLFSVAVRIVLGPVEPADIVVSVIGTVLISAAIGAVAGFVATWIVARVDDHLVELTISVVLAYGTYLLADEFHESGIIATVVAGIVLGTYGRRIGFSDRAREALDIVWEFTAFLLTAFVFLLVGLAITVSDLVNALAPIAWGVVAILLGRAFVVYVMLGVPARLLGRRLTSAALPLAWLHVMFWAGLRGAVAVALALALPVDMPQRALLQSITFGIVLFTLLVQGTTIDFVLRRTGIGGAEPAAEAGSAGTGASAGSTIAGAATAAGATTTASTTASAPSADA